MSPVDAKTVYTEVWAEEQEGTPRPSPLRALALTAVRLEAALGDDAQLGAAVRIAVDSARDEL